MERIGRAKAIRLKCIDCCCGNTAEVRRCPATTCSLWRFRMGKEIKDTCGENIEISDENENEDFE